MTRKYRREYQVSQEEDNPEKPKRVTAKDVEPDDQIGRMFYEGAKRRKPDQK
jgi:hypothetical protein